MCSGCITEPIQIMRLCSPIKVCLCFFFYLNPKLILIQLESNIYVRLRTIKLMLETQSKGLRVFLFLPYLDIYLDALE